MSQQKLVIKTSPIVFIKRLIVIEFLFALSTALLSFWVDVNQIYSDFQLTRFGPLSLLIGLVITAFQVLIIALAFITWYADSYEVDRDKIIHRRGNLFGTSEITRAPFLTRVTVNQSKLGERFNYGTLELITLDAAKQGRLEYVPDPTRYATLVKEMVAPPRLEADRWLQKPIPDIIAEGEGQYAEFKSSFSWDYRQQRINKDLNKAVMKNIVAFMNTTGGVLLMGVGDEGEILGLEVEMQTLKKPNIDGFENVFNMAFNKMIGVEQRHYIILDFAEIDHKTVGRIIVSPTPEPVYLHQGNKEEFFVRTGNSSQPLTISQAVKYIQTHFET